MPLVFALPYPHLAQGNRGYSVPYPNLAQGNRGYGLPYPNLARGNRGYGCHPMRRQPHHPHADFFIPYPVGRPSRHAYQPACKPFAPNHVPYPVDPYLRAVEEEEQARAFLEAAIAREEHARRRRVEAERRAESIRQARVQMFGPRSRTSVPPSSAWDNGRTAYQRPPATQNVNDAEMILEAAFGQLLRFLSAVSDAGQSGHPETSPHDKEEGASNLRRKVRFTPDASSGKSESTHNSWDEFPNAAFSLHAFSKLRELALQQISDLASQFDTLKGSFTFPTTLDFNFSPSDVTPSLAYTPINAPIHSHNESLLLILQALDGIDSNGDLHVRGARRELVRAVEAELEGVESAVRHLWEKKEKGKGKDVVRDGIVKVVVRAEGEKEEKVEETTVEGQAVSADARPQTSVHVSVQPNMGEIAEPTAVPAESHSAQDAEHQAVRSIVTDSSVIHNAGTTDTNTTMSAEVERVTVDPNPDTSAELDALMQDDIVNSQSTVIQDNSDVPMVDGDVQFTSYTDADGIASSQGKQISGEPAVRHPDLLVDSTEVAEDPLDGATSLLEELDIIEEIVVSRRGDDTETVGVNLDLGVIPDWNVPAAGDQPAAERSADDLSEDTDVSGESNEDDITTRGDETDGYIDVSSDIGVEVELDTAENTARHEIASASLGDEGDVEFVVV